MGSAHLDATKTVALVAPNVDTDTRIGIMITPALPITFCAKGFRTRKEQEKWMHINLYKMHLNYRCTHTVTTRYSDTYNMSVTKSCHKKLIEI